METIQQEAGKIAHDLEIENEAFKFLKKKFIELWAESSERTIQKRAAEGDAYSYLLTDALHCSPKMRALLEGMGEDADDAEDGPGSDLLRVIRSAASTNSHTETYTKLLEAADTFPDFVYLINALGKYKLMRHADPMFNVLEAVFGELRK